MTNSVNNAAQQLAQTLTSPPDQPIATAQRVAQPQQQEKAQKVRKDYGFKGFWDDSIYGLLFRAAGLIIGFALLRFALPAQAIQWFGWCGAMGLAICLRVRDCQQNFPLWGWAFLIYMAATSHDAFWNWSNP